MRAKRSWGQAACLLVVIPLVLGVILAGKTATVPLYQTSARRPNPGALYDSVAMAGNFTGTIDPSIIAVDNMTGNVYVCDASLRAVLVFDSQGTFLGEVGNPGTGDGQFGSVAGVAINQSGYIYVVDQGNSRVQVFNPDGTFCAKWGTPGSGPGQFAGALGIALNGSGSVFVTETTNHRVQVFSPTGAYLSSFGAAQLQDPQGIAINASGYAFVGDIDTTTVQVFAPDGSFFTQWGGIPHFSVQGPRAIAFNSTGQAFVTVGNGSVWVYSPDGKLIGGWGNDSLIPTTDWGITINPTLNKVYVAYDHNQSIMVFDQTGTYISKLGYGTRAPIFGLLGAPCGICETSTGNIVVADDMVNHIYSYAADTGAYEATWSFGWVGAGIAVNSSGNFYVTGWEDSIHVLSPTGTDVNSWGGVGSTDGKFSTPGGIAVNGSGYVYVVDRGNNRIQVFTPSGQFITKFGSSGSQDGNFSAPAGIAINGSGDVFVTDSGNHRVEVFSPSGQFVGKWGQNGTEDGNFTTPYGIAVGPDRRIYVTDFDLNRVQVFTPSGQFVGKWGSIGWQVGELREPAGIVVDNASRAWVTEYAGDRAQAFVVGVAPAAPTLLTVLPNPSTDGIVTLTWTVMLGAINYLVYRGETYITSLNSTTSFVANLTGTSWQDSLAANSTYYYVVVAANATGNSSLSNCLSVLVAIPAPTGPASPTLLSVSPNPSADGKVFLSWTISPGAAEYKVYRGTGFITILNSTMSLVADLTGTSWQDALAANGTYYYVVVAANATGASGISNCLGAVVAIPPSLTTGNSSPSGNASPILLVAAIAIGATGSAGCVAIAVVVRSRRQRRRIVTKV